MMSAVAETAAQQADAGEKFKVLYHHMMEQPYFVDGPLVAIADQPIPVQVYGVTNHILAQLVAGLLLLLVFCTLARRRLRSAASCGVFENVFESMVIWVRDEVVYKTMGEHHGRRFLPLFLTQFFFILALNLFGLLPNFHFPPGFPTTATANISVTLGLALVTLFTIHFSGVREHGAAKYLQSWIPSGLSLPMKLLMYPIELLGHLIKPTALTIRLFANMTGGHLAMLTIFGLIYMFSKEGENLAVGIPVLFIGVGFGVFLVFLEILVALIQAFIFTYLSVIFIGAAVHPQH
ncbi:MAG: F0F1 ATP synthase subunit A [Planctomycetota bacterium]